MKPYKFDVKAVNFNHLCTCTQNDHCQHSTEFTELINEKVLSPLLEINFTAEILNRKNSLQINANAFDSKWHTTMTDRGWKDVRFNRIEWKENGIEIEPDALLENNDRKCWVEIEKTNKKTIWFDFIKMFIAIRLQSAHYGLLIVPTNYAHNTGCWNLFTDAQKYRSALLQYAEVPKGFFEKLAILGYTQQIKDDQNNWCDLDVEKITIVKKKAVDYFHSNGN